MRNLGLKLFKAPQEIQDKLKTAKPYLACHKVLSPISKRDVVILEAYQLQDSREERKENSKKLYEPLSNASGSDTNYTQRLEHSGGDIFIRDKKIERTIRKIKIKVNRRFHVPNIILKIEVVYANVKVVVKELKILNI